MNAKVIADVMHGVVDDGLVAKARATQAEKDAERQAREIEDGIAYRKSEAGDELYAALIEALPLLKGHQETPERAARYQRAVAAIALADNGK